MTFQHDLGDRLQLRWLNTDGDTWELEAKLLMAEPADLTDQKLTIAFHKAGVPKLSIPLYAFVKATKK